MNRVMERMVVLSCGWMQICLVLLVVPGCSKQDFSLEKNLSVEQAASTVLYENNRLKDGVDKAVNTLSFPNVESVSPEVATELSKYKGESISLGVKQLTPEVARALMEIFSGRIDLNELRSLELSSAKYLSRARSVSVVNAQLDAETISVLVNGDTKYLTIGNKALFKEVAQVLGRSKLELIGLMRVSDVPSDVLKEFRTLKKSTIQFDVRQRIVVDEGGLKELAELGKLGLLTSFQVEAAKKRIAMGR